LKVVLISLYLFDNMSARSIHANLKSGGQEVYSLYLKIYYPNMKIKMISDKEMQILMRKIKEINPDIVGISVRSPYINIANSVTKSIKKEIGVPVIYGGVHATLMPEECLNYADMVCVGEGDEAFPELVNRLENKQRYNDIKGIWVKENGQIKDNGYAVVRDLDKITFNSFDENNFYIENNEISKNSKKWFGLNRFLLSITNFVGYYDVMAGRGCPFKCSFCINGVEKDGIREMSKVRYRSTDSVIHEILTAKNKYYITGVYFHDDVFTTDEKWAKEFLGKYKKYINLPFMINTHFLHIDHSLLTNLKESGLKVVKLGIQSGSETTNRFIYNRWFDRDKIIEKAKIIKDLRIFSIYDFLHDNPLEKDTDRESTLKLIMDIPHPFGLSMYPLKFYPGYRISQYMQNLSIPEEQIGSTEAVLRNWNYKFLKVESKNNMFWNSLYWLAAENILPGESLLFLAKSKILKNNPVWLKLFCCIIYLFSGHFFFLLGGYKKTYFKDKNTLSGK